MDFKLRQTTSKGIAFLLIPLFLLALAGCGDGGQKASAQQGREDLVDLLHQKAGREADDSPPSLRSEFALLRGPAELVPAAVATVVERSLGTADTGLDLRRGQRVHTEAGSLWWVSGRGLGCIAQPRYGTVSCNTLASIRHEGIFLGVFTIPRHRGEQRRFIAFGLVPDQVRAVWLKVGRGEARPVEVESNAYALGAGKPVKLVDLGRSR
jgi:hypothetical protein